MRLAVIAAAAALAACTPPPPPPPPASPAIPEEAKTCPPADPVPLPPKQIRTVEAIAAYAKSSNLSATKNASALTICDQRRQELLDLLTK